MEPLAWLPRLGPEWIPSPGPAATIQGKEAGPARRTLDGRQHTVLMRVSPTVSVHLPFRSSSTSHIVLEVDLAATIQGFE